MHPVISKLFYAVLVSSLQQQPPSSSHQPSARLSKKSRFKRATSIVHLIDRIIPGVAKKLSRRIYVNSQFPWAPVDMGLIARGSGAAVFKLRWRSGEKVLRIYRRSLGHSLEGLLKVAAYYRDRYQTVLTWYGASPSLVAPMDFLVLQGPRLVGPVVASLQPFIHGQKYDLFEDYSNDEIVSLLKENCIVREQFLFFARQTLQQWQDGDMCFDFLGTQNLMLVKQGASYRLCIADMGIFQFDTVMQRYPWKMSKIERRMSRLDRLYKLARAM